MRYFLSLIYSIFAFIACAQPLKVPSSVGDSHPRIYGVNMSKENCQVVVLKKDWAAKVVTNTKKHLAPVMQNIEQESDWLVSRLQMYWSSKHNQVYINGGSYSHAEGESLAPTVKFIGQRGWSNSQYNTPKLEDVKPYMDDERGLYLQNKKTGQWEWGAIESTGGVVSSINKSVMRYAKEAAFLYWLNGEEQYAKVAYEVLDTYLTGIYYLNEPIDISHGHHQTLVSYTEFEVIQEHIIADITACYDFLYHYIEDNHQEKIPFYGTVFQKWCDQQIKNGVSFNNWNLFQALHISRMALVMEDNDFYANGKGGPYYLDQIMNHTSIRQWSMTKLIDYGYGQEGIWCESPGYSVNVCRDFIHFVKFYDENFGIDLIAQLPILETATENMVQYLMPNAYMVAFGDGHYKQLPVDAFQYMIQNAQKFNRPQAEQKFTKLLKTLAPDMEMNGEFVGSSIEDLFVESNFKIDESIEAGHLSDFLYPTFYAANTSWITQRADVNNVDDALMYSMIGSLGNHMHSNGIAIELYGKGLPLAPELGHGTSYFHSDYAEYYTQFPAHNTVAVNGKSKYPEMKANHAFTMNALYPQSMDIEEQSDILFSDVSFLEPETHSDQRRQVGIVNHEVGGYYIDIFRSKQMEGNDVKHEYFFHNLGQELELTATNGEALDLQETSSLSFGDGDLFGYDYMWAKKSVKTNEDFKGKFTLNTDERVVDMNLWFEGNNDREVFSVMSPKSTAHPYVGMSKEINESPTPTLVVRQNGEAWNRPFVAIYEPAENNESSIENVKYFGEGEQVGICVENKLGVNDYIFSNTEEQSDFAYQGMMFKGSYAVVSRDDDNIKLLLGHGKELQAGGFTIIADEEASVYLEQVNDKLTMNSTSAFELRIKSDKKNVIFRAVGSEVVYQAKYDKKAKELVFRLPMFGNRNQFELEYN